MPEIQTVEQQLAEARRWAEEGGLIQADFLCREIIDADPEHAAAHHLLARVAWQADLFDLAVRYLNRACQLAPKNEEIIKGLAQARKGLEQFREKQAARDSGHPKFLLIKAWAHGFFSDVDHVLGGLLLAEMTGRVPVVYWGGSSLYAEQPESDAFTQFYEAVSNVSLSDLEALSEASFFPPLWSADTLKKVQRNVWEGRYGHMGGLKLLGRQEQVVISDFFLSVAELMPWIKPGHPYHGLPIARIYRDLIDRHLKLKPAVSEEIESFYADHLAQSPYVAMHIRETDKIYEQARLAKINAVIEQQAEVLLQANPGHKLFLMTDSLAKAQAIESKYGPRCIMTACQRSANEVGVHFQKEGSPFRRGIEIMLDSYLAARGDYFLGNGGTNPSCMVMHLKKWPEGRCRVVPPVVFHQRNRRMTFGEGSSV